MIYLALLRAVNVGGNKVEMAKLKLTFEGLGFGPVKTFIASGNVIFRSAKADRTALARRIETAIERDFGLTVSVLLRDLPAMAYLVQALPSTWVNDKFMKCDVMFLWPDIDRPAILADLPSNEAIEDIKYLPGAVVWRIDRDKVSHSRMFKLVGTKLHKRMTVRNPNTVRKIYQLMLDMNDGSPAG